MPKSKLDREQLRDSLRIAVQSSAGAGAAYLIVSALAPDHVTWAVISALFVVGHDVDATFKRASGRLMGAVFGTMVGLALAAALPGPSLSLLRLVIGAMVLEAVAVRVPTWRYGVVTAAIIALDPGANVYDGAIDRGLAILGGSACGLAAALLIWRDSAEHRARRSLRRALVHCSELVQAALPLPAEGEGPDLGPIHRRITARLEEAKSAASSQSLKPGRRPGVQQLVKAVERLWHGLVMIDRVATGWSLPDHPQQAERLRSVLEDAREQICHYLTALVLLLREEPAAFRSDHLGGAIDAAFECVQELARSHPRSVAMHGLAFGLVEVEGNLQELRRALEGARLGEAPRSRFERSVLNRPKRAP